MSQSVLLTEQQLADRLGVTKRWIQDERRAGRIPHVALSERVIRFDPESVDAWWRARMQGPVRRAA